MNPTDPVPGLSIRFADWSVRPDNPEGIAFGSQLTVTVVVVAIQRMEIALLFCRHGLRLSGRVTLGDDVYHYRELARDVVLEAGREYTYDYTFTLADQAAYRGSLFKTFAYVEAAAISSRGRRFNFTKEVNVTKQDHAKLQVLNAQPPTGLS